ncbi:hypothetical protein ACQY0O_005966 [Thecaphora frezii]
MNGLMLPTGSKPPTTGDTGAHLGVPGRSASTSPGTAASVLLATTHLPSPQACRMSVSPPKASAKSAASLAFIPRTSRTSTVVRKPLSRCSEFELADMLDRNQRILATPLPSLEPHLSPSSAARTPPTRARERLRRETDDIRRELLAKRGLRQIRDDMSRWQIDDAKASDPRSASPTSKEALAEAMQRLSVQASAPSGSASARSIEGQRSLSDSLAWQRDTLAVKRRLAQETQNAIPGSRVQQLSYEQSLALQSAALVAERERERRAEEAAAAASVGASASRDRTHNGLPAGPAHRLGRKSISSGSNAVRKGAGSPPSGGAGRFGPCPGFGVAARRSSHTNAAPTCFDQDELATVAAATAESDYDPNDDDEEDVDEHRLPVSPSDNYEADDDPDAFRCAGDMDDMAFDNEFD